MNIENLIDMLKADKFAKTVTYFESPTSVIRVTKSNKHQSRKNVSSRTFLVSVGKPNYLGRIFVKMCKKAGEPFPVKRPQITFYPKAKPKKKKCTVS